MEDRLRNAFRADAETIQPETIRPPATLSQAARPSKTRPLRRPSGLGRSPGPLRSRGRRIGVPLAAAAAVAAIVVAATIAGPGIFAAHGGHGPSPAGGLAGGYPGHRLPGSAPPRFYVALQVTKAQQNEDYATTLYVYSTATGRRVGQLPSLVRNRFFQAVAPLGNDRTFVAAASPGQREGKNRACGTWLYRFRLTRQGRPTGLTLLAPEIAGIVPSDTLAASADGNVVAYDAAACVVTPSSAIRDYGQIGVLNVGSRQLKRWTYRFPAKPGSLSLSADGSLLGMVSNPSQGTRVAGESFNYAWVLRTSSPAGQLGRNYRKVTGPPEGVTAAVLSPTGSVLVAVAAQFHPENSAHRQSLPLTTYRTRTGAQIGGLRIFPRLHSSTGYGAGGAGGVDVSPDISGRYLLVSDWTQRLEAVDLATGHNRFLRRSDYPITVGAAW